MCAIPQLVSAPLNPIPIAEHFRRSHPQCEHSYGQHTHTDNTHTHCASSLEYSSLSTLAGLSYHICGKLEVAFKGSASSQHQHCTDEAQKAETVGALSDVLFAFLQNCQNALFPVPV